MDGFEQLYDACYAPVLGYALRRTGDRAEAEDVVAETFLVAWRRRDDLPAGDAALPWLYGVARRVLANRRRADGRRAALVERLGASAAPAFASSSREGRLAAALAGLPEHEREAILLVAWEGLSTHDAAVAAGCSDVAMRVRLSRARRRLKHRLALDDPPATLAHDPA